MLGERGIEELIALRIVTLIEREEKNEAELKELDALIKRDIQYKAQWSKANERSIKIGE